MVDGTPPKVFGDRRLRSMLHPKKRYLAVGGKVSILENTVSLYHKKFLKRGTLLLYYEHGKKISLF